MIFRRSLSYLNGSNTVYVEELYNLWKHNPDSVHKSWHVLFKMKEQGHSLEQIFISPSKIPCSSGKTTSITGTGRTSDNSTSVLLMEAFRSQGHLMAKLDPLELEISDAFNNSVLSSHLANIGDNILNQPATVPREISSLNLPASASIRDLITTLQKTYSGKFSIEFKHIEDHSIVSWIEKKIEGFDESSLLSPDMKILGYKRLVQASMFEQSLAKKFPSEKRFGVEGCEALIPSMGQIIDACSFNGTDEFFIGMSHRGRLNVLVNICEVPASIIFALFNHHAHVDGDGSGDVKYHLGSFKEVKNEVTKKNVKLSLLCNPSHLEAVDPLVMGTTKAEQFYRNDQTGSAVMSILVHGDASFAAQGVVYESLQMSKLAGYGVHGTVHIVVNNQIGFTTNPSDSRSSRYCTDIAKVIQAPIFHVNAQDIDSVLAVSQLAAEYRSKFKQDVVIDLIGFRKNGHNEGDNPQFTQPIMYSKISKMSNVVDVYGASLVKDGILKKDDQEAIISQYADDYESSYQDCLKMASIPKNALCDQKPTLIKGSSPDHIIQEIHTGIDREILQKLNEACCELPEDLKLSPVLSRVLKNRQILIKGGKVDWALGEISAIASILTEGVHVRLSGQDVQRGTFSHRHHVLHDLDGKRENYTPLNNLSPSQAKYVVCNSLLSEFGVLGFELGYSYANPNALVIWEAQFGDFSNNAQCIFDQMISCSREKWYKETGIVALLPHGYDGMGPEHSSARMERFLTFSSEDPDTFPDFGNQDFEVSQLHAHNLTVLNCTTPANIFHALRRQVKLPFRRPAVVISPKSLLRLEAARSDFSEMSSGTKFQRVISDPHISLEESQNVQRIVFCSGKIYYELEQAKIHAGLSKTVALARIEQLAPFPFDLVKKECEKYPSAECIWAQDEPKNQGAWSFIAPRLFTATSRKFRYVGRASSAATATGCKTVHTAEQEEIVKNSITL